MDIKSAQAKGFGGDGGKQYTVENDITPLKKRVLVSDMHFGETKSKGGIILVDDDGTAEGIHPRWGKIYDILLVSDQEPDFNTHKAGYINMGGAQQMTKLPGND